LFPSSSIAQLKSIYGFVRGVSSSFSKYFITSPPVIELRNLESLFSVLLVLKLLPLPDVDPKTLPRFVEGELKLWLPAREPSPADLSEVSLCFELKSVLFLIFGPMKRFDFCLGTESAFKNLSFYYVLYKSYSSSLSEYEGDLIIGDSYLNVCIEG